MELILKNMKLSLSNELYNKAGIYRIKSSIDGRAYIGSTIKLKRRYNDHNRSLKNKSHQSPYLQNFANKYGIDNLTFELIELCEPIKLIEIEQKWIDFYNNKELLFNICKIAANSLGYKHTPETLNKMKNKNVSAETRKKQSEWQKGVPKSTELIKKFIIAQKGKPKSDSFKKLMSKKMKGNKNGVGTIRTEEVKKIVALKVSAALKGRKLSEERKKQISDSSPFKGIKRTEEYKKQMSDNSPLKGIKRTEEYKKQMSDRAKKYYETHSSPRKGVKLSEETKQKIIETKKNNRLKRLT